MKLKVTYMSGAGNLFSIIDNRNYNFGEKLLSLLSPILCNPVQNNTIQSEGLLALNERKDYDFEALFFNPDGSHGMMCGNGGRCAVNFALLNNFYYDKKQNEYVSFMMLGENYRARVGNDEIELFLPPPMSIDPEKELPLFDQVINYAYVNVNTDHVVINIEELCQFGVNDIVDLDIYKFGKAVRYHKDFLPSGANANFFQVRDNNTLILRTYERGVEKETGACGTGAVSTAIVANFKHEVQLPIIVIPPSKSPLIINFDLSLERKISNLSLTGSADILKEDEVEIPDEFLK